MRFQKIDYFVSLEIIATEKERKKMFGTRLCGAILIAGILWAGAARAEGNPEQALENRTPEQASTRNEATTLTKATPPGPADAAASEKTPTNKEELDPKAETAQKDESAPKTEVSPKQDAAKEDADTEGIAEEEPSIADPIEPFNRAMFTFNDKLYFWVLKPVAQGYNVIVPQPARVSVRNLFRNIKMPIRFVNSLLQGKFVGAGTELARFGINTTIGVGGLFDIAKDKFDLDPSDEDFGQTLGFYGMDGLMYIVWPFFGPSTVRDSVGMVGDSFLNPTSYIGYIGPWEASVGVSVFETINKTSLALGEFEDLKASSLEPYIAFRDGYVQLRKKQINK